MRVAGELGRGEVRILGSIGGGGRGEGRVWEFRV